MSNHTAKTLTAFLGNADLTDALCELMSVAADIDRLETELVSNAKHAAERFAMFATRIESGCGSDVPNGWSSVESIPVDYASLQSKREELRRLARIILGAEKAKALVAALAVRS